MHGTKQHRLMDLADALAEMDDAAFAALLDALQYRIPREDWVNTDPQVKPRRTKHRE